MDTQGRASGCRKGFLRAILTASFMAIGPVSAVWANVPEVGAAPTSYEQAMESYSAGNAQLALSRARAAAGAGDPMAQLLAGHILRNGETAAPNYSEAASYYRKAAAQNNDDAMVALGEMAVSGQGGLFAQDAVNWLNQAAKLGRTDAMRALSDLYIKGVGVARNIAEGEQWLSLAAEQGDVLAARRMGDLNIDRSPQIALSYYERAARLGDPESAYFAAIMYAENLSIKPNEARAASLMEQAALAFHPAAMADYGLLIYQGRAGDGSAQTAAGWFEKSAKLGDDQGKFLFAYSLAKGDGVSQDFASAYYWLLKTKKSGIPAYDKDIDTLKLKLEENVDPAVLDQARKRAGIL